ncbi:hypothetical protein ACQEVI_23280 [Promicromonospora sp. CA-289599]|uniref:hypothetical protein n=1 Tax=Promicromonospora sp. CA-289599 TaxID=3240014 RepID=UPI003D8A71EC
MDENRPVHDVLRERTGSGDTPGAVADALRAAGHDLPHDLVAEAVASFADTAPTAVAEHLSSFTTAYGPEGLADPADLDAAEMLPDGLALLASAPAVDQASHGEAIAFGTGAGTGEPNDDVVVPDVGADASDAFVLGDLDAADQLDPVPGSLDTRVPDETFDPAELDAELDAEDVQDTDLPF